MKNIWKIIFILLIIGLIIYLFKDFFNNEENNNNDDDNITNKTNNVVIDDDYNTNYSKNNTIDLDSLLVTGNIKLNNNIITLKNGGDYYISGTNNAQIIIDSSDKNIVHLVLDNVNLTYNYSPIYIKNAEKVIITVIGENTISDTSNYNDDKIDATIYSKDDLVINGDGILNINGNYKNGVVSNDGLKIINTTLNIVSNNNGIKGKDYVYLEDSNINITSNGDGIKSNNDSDSSLGFVTIKGGAYNMDSQTDGIQAETILYIEDGNFNIKTGNGSQNDSYTNNNWGVWGNNDDNESAKGLKAGTTIIIDNGEFLLDTSDDSIHSNDEILIKNGTFNLSSGDDGIHADDDLTIENGNITINKSYEGIEASIININNGNINIISSDDGEFVNLLDHFYGGYQPWLIDFSNSSGDKYPMEECSLVGL